jgi:hypothetical protein
LVAPTTPICKLAPTNTAAADADAVEAGTHAAADPDALFRISGMQPFGRGATRGRVQVSKEVRWPRCDL